MERAGACWSVLKFVNWEIAWRNGCGDVDDDFQERYWDFKMDLVSGDASFMTVVVVGTILVVGQGSLRMFWWIWGDDDDDNVPEDLADRVCWWGLLCETVLVFVCKVMVMPMMIDDDVGDDDIACWIFTSLSIGKLRRFTVLLEIVQSISPLDLYLVLVRSLCELSLGLELYLVLSIASAASFRVGRNSHGRSSVNQHTRVRDWSGIPGAVNL